MISIDLIVLGALAYAAGSIPFHRFLGLSDIDAGETTRHHMLATLRFILNVVKGLVIVEIGCLYDPTVALATAYFVCLGHNYPIWTTFKGGTGLGVIVGALAALEPNLGLFGLVSWLTTYYVFQRSALAAVAAAIATPYLAGFLPLPFSPLMLLPLSCLVLWRHRLAVTEALSIGPKDTEDAFRNL